MDFLHFYESNKPFVIFSHQGESEIFAIVEGEGADVFKASPFAVDKEAEEIEIRGSIVSLDPVKLDFGDHYRDYRVEDLIPPEKQISILNKTIEALQEDFMMKVVISQSKKVHLPRPSFRILLQSLVDSDPKAFNYIFFHPKSGIWAGSTPEKLVELKGNHFSTIALAGTRVTESIENFPWTHKEKEEQELVTEYILERLEGACHHVQMNGPQNENAAHLTHLATHISGISDIDKHELIQRLHPTPAVCGIPLEAAQNFILKNESHQRLFYTGYISVELGEDIFSYVNIRCMNIFDQYCVLYAGAGITAASNSEAEWKECEEKLKVLLRTIQKL